MNEESTRISERDPHQLIQKWEAWGPFLSDRAWGTVREDYSANGDAWNYFTHDQARKRAYRWGEDGLAGICDRFQVLNFAPAFWNGQDPILKERLFGLNSNEGNHGEDVKEVYYYLDATPTASYLKCLYKYPQGAFPYDLLVQENGRRGPADREFELLDTRIFDQNKYFDIFIEYAKADAEDICIKIEAFNRGPDAAPLHILAQLWFRNQWGWTNPPTALPSIGVGTHAADAVCIVADDTPLLSPHVLLNDYHLKQRYLYATPGAELLFTNNDSNCEDLWQSPNASPFVKDAFHRYLIAGEKGAINPAQTGTKAAIHYKFDSVPSGSSQVIYLRLSAVPLTSPLAAVESTIAQRKSEADSFYESISPQNATDEEKMIQRQAFAGMNWSKQLYYYSVSQWMVGDFPPPPDSHSEIRNKDWYHLYSMKVISMPDKWEYPWFASWDLSFQSVCFGLMDIELAKSQLTELFTDRFQHPNGQIPAYEWEFSDVNPPVQAWAALKLFELEEKQTGSGDFVFLEKCFQRLLINFAWWINRVDAAGNNVFEGGFLGLDNIGFTNRTSHLASGLSLDEVDGAGWISMLCLNLMRMALTLSKKNSVYEGMATKFLYHFVYVTAAMRKGQWRDYDLWNDADGFFHSFFRADDGRFEMIPSRTLVGVVPFFATDAWTDAEFQQFPEFYKAYQWLTIKRPDLANMCIQHIPDGSGGCQHIFGLLNKDELTKYLNVLWDPNEFRSPFGLRSSSKAYENVASVFNGMNFLYEPGESREKLMGGNSNWRGPIWFPMNFLFIDTLEKLGIAYKDTIQVQASGENPATITDMSKYFSGALMNLFKKDASGKRPSLGDCDKFQTDPNFKDYLFFYEHFHGENGRGLGASHQTGWTGLIANLIEKLRK